MLTLRLRLLASLVAALLTFVALAAGHALFAVLWAACTLWLWWGYFREGSVWLALAAYRFGNVERMRSHVRTVRWPRLLSRRCRGYYHWLQGVALAIDGRLAPARDHMLAARRWGFRSAHHRSIMECQLADMAIRCGEPAQAWSHLRAARELRRHPAIDSLIAAVEARIPAEAR
ncbi:MAG TPA: hypothetical protein VHM67_06755 [Gemmatimonadaceae bacterium]|nr:hypothetical protein [Gemmatimonadaceae bacterium]